MPTIITSGDITLTPDAIDGYSSERESGNIVHPILGRANPDTTLRAASLRTGTLRLTFGGEAESKEAEDVHAVGGVFAIISPERSSVEMSYTLADRGRIRRTWDNAGFWTLEVDYQETIDAGGVAPIIIVDGGTPDDPGEGFLDGGAP